MQLIEGLFAAVELRGTDLLMGALFTCTTTDLTRPPVFVVQLLNFS